MRLKLISIFIVSHVLVSAQIQEAKLDDLIRNTLKTFDVPGVSVGIIKDGKTVYSKGFGIRSLKDGKPMDASTLVGIASNSKGFTCTALAILADEGKLNWDDKVTKFLPGFKMYDDCVTREITIKDLVTHRAGLGLGQGDLMFFPEGGTQTVEQVVHNVRFLKPDHSFRNAMDYNNVMYIVAGEIIHKISGKSWAEFIEERIFKPVGMSGSYGSYNRAAAVANKISAHAPVDGKVAAVPHDWNETANAAGGIMSNIPDMLKWAEFLMNGFTTNDGKKLVSDKQIKQLWQIQQPIPVALKNPYDTHFYGYGMGWFLSDVKGQFQVQHTGGLIGTVTQFTLLPELKLGIVVLTNQQSGLAFNSITNTVKDAYLGIPERNWLKTYAETNVKNTTEYGRQKSEVYAKSAVFAKNKTSLFSAGKFVGTYRDPWFGEVEISKAKSGFSIVSKTSPRMSGELLPYSEDTFVVKWKDRSYDADAFITFKFDETGSPISATMKPISDVTDFSFDFQDLELKRVK